MAEKKRGRGRPRKETRGRPAGTRNNETLVEAAKKALRTGKDLAIIKTELESSIEELSGYTKDDGTVVNPDYNNLLKYYTLLIKLIDNLHSYTKEDAKKKGKTVEESVQEEEGNEDDVVIRFKNTAS